MKQHIETDALNEVIRLLEIKRAEEFNLLKEQFHLVQDRLKPINLIKSVFQEITATPAIKHNIVNSTIGLTTGFLAKKVLFGTARNPVSKLFGTLFQFVITNVVAKHSDSIKSTGENLLQRFLKRIKQS